MNVTGNLSSSFLFNWQNLFSRFHAIVSFVSGRTVWDYDFFIGSITVAGILLDVELQLFWTWADSCRQVFQECIHRVQTNPSMEKISYRKKNRIFHHLQKLSGNVFFKIWQKYFTNVVIVWFYVSRRIFCGLFLNKKHWYPLTLIKVFSDFWHFSFATFFRKAFNRSSKRVGGEFFCVLQSPFFMISGKLSKSFSVIRWYLLWIFLESASYVSRATIWS